MKLQLTPKGHHLQKRLNVWTWTHLCYINYSNSLFFTKWVFYCHMHTQHKVTFEMLQEKNVVS